MFTWLDATIFFGTLLGAMVIGWIAGRKEDKADDYFLAGRSVPWWGVAGSIFGTNISANHLVGMLGIGFSIGFAQTHYELGAVAALILLCYFFLPAYRRLGLTTLSELLERRFGPAASLCYTVILLTLICVQLSAGFYIGARSFAALMEGTPLEMSYEVAVLGLALFAGLYTIFGGLKAVVYTDVIQSVLLILGGGLVAYFTIFHPDVGGWAAMMDRDAALGDERKMQMMLPMNHPDLPWSGALSGLMLLHCFYWGTNQYIVQRALAATDDRSARIGTLAGGFLKLLIPFFSIAAGVAGAQLFSARGLAASVDPDDAFPELVRLVTPLGYGLLGLIASGLIGAILSTLDSLLNSASTLLVVDIYKKRFRPDADDRTQVLLGRLGVVATLVISTFFALASYSPDQKGNFFLVVSGLSSHFTPGLLVAFIAALSVRRLSARAAVLAIALSPIFSFALEAGYNALAPNTGLAEIFGARLNFMHRTLVVAAVAALILFVGTRLDSQSRAPADQLAKVVDGARDALRGMAPSIIVFAVCGVAVGLAIEHDFLSRQSGAWIGAGAALAATAIWIQREPWIEPDGENKGRFDDRWLAAILAAAVAYILFRFF